MREEERAPLARRFLVAGRVQQVGFRAATRRKASQLGVDGYARNLPDGRVEVLACGDARAVAALRQWLRDGGPAAAKVERLDESEASASGSGFRIE